MYETTHELPYRTKLRRTNFSSPIEIFVTFVWQKILSIGNFILFLKSRRLIDHLRWHFVTKKFRHFCLTKFSPIRYKQYLVIVSVRRTWLWSRALQYINQLHLITIVASNTLIPSNPPLNFRSAGGRKLKGANWAPKSGEGRKLKGAKIKGSELGTENRG